MSNFTLLFMFFKKTCLSCKFLLYTQISTRCRLASRRPKSNKSSSKKTTKKWISILTSELHAAFSHCFESRFSVMSSRFFTSISCLIFNLCIPIFVTPFLLKKYNFPDIYSFNPKSSVFNVLNNFTSFKVIETIASCYDF